MFVKYLRKNYPKYATLLRPDADQDGLYDIFESDKFGTDPANPDSDGDGILDGKEARLPPVPTATPTATPTSTQPAI